MMGIVHTKYCEHCGAEYTCKTTKAKLCSECRKEWQRIDALNHYYRKKGIDKHIEFERREFLKPPKSKPMFRWKGRIEKCTFDHCPFKSGNRPCLFYFEYENGTASCPGMRYMKESDNFGLEKRSD